MITVGKILKEARNRKKMSLADIEKSTKIRAKFLESIEEDDFAKLPSGSYAKGFVKNYSLYLGLDGEKILAFYRRQTKDKSIDQIAPSGFKKPLNSPIFRLTPTRFIVLVVIFFMVLFLLYFGLQYKKIQSPPLLSVESPKDMAELKEKRIDVLGKTDPDASVTVNGINILVRSDGKFFDKVTLEPGRNFIEISAISRFGKTATVNRTVIYLDDKNQDYMP